MSTQSGTPGSEGPWLERCIRYRGSRRVVWNAGRCPAHRSCRSVYWHNYASLPLTVVSRELQVHVLVIDVARYMDGEPAAQPRG